MNIVETKKEKHFSHFFEKILVKMLFIGGSKLQTETQIKEFQK